MTSTTTLPQKRRALELLEREVKRIVIKPNRQATSCLWCECTTVPIELSTKSNLWDIDIEWQDGKLYEVFSKGTVRAAAS